MLAASCIVRGRIKFYCWHKKKRERVNTLSRSGLITLTVYFFLASCSARILLLSCRILLTDVLRGAQPYQCM